MTTRIVIPVKILSHGKSRLDGVLDAAQRAALCRQLLTRTFDLARSVAPVIVTTADPWVREVSVAAGATVIGEPAGGLNAALDAARHAIPDGDHMLILPIDLPRLRRDTLVALACASPDVVIVPDHHGAGTNMLALPPAAVPVYRFMFGPDSFQRHSDEARRLGLRAVRQNHPDAAFDIDTPEDLALLSQDAS
jgi:2-phospho-L-lactate guanylyltransferase